MQVDMGVNPRKVGVLDEAALARGAGGQGTIAAQGRRGRAIGTPLMAIGALAWLVAWFVPAVSLDGPSHPDSLLKGGPDSGPVYGAQAFLFAAYLVPTALERAELDTAVVGATCATNFVMLAALILHRLVPWGRALGFAVIACALLNTTWLFLGEPGMAAALRAGYYMWLASFVLTGAGIVAATPRS
jgi:hypothetical protein